MLSSFLKHMLFCVHFSFYVHVFKNNYIYLKQQREYIHCDPQKSLFISRYQDLIMITFFFLPFLFPPLLFPKARVFF